MCHTQKLKNGRKLAPKNCCESFLLEKGVWLGLIFSYFPLHTWWLTPSFIQSAAKQFLGQHQRKHCSMLRSEVCTLLDICDDSLMRKWIINWICTSSSGLFRILQNIFDGAFWEYGVIIDTEHGPKKVYVIIHIALPRIKE